MLPWSLQRRGAVSSRAALTFNTRRTEVSPAEPTAAEAC